MKYYRHENYGEHLNAWSKYEMHEDDELIEAPKTAIESHKFIHDELLNFEYVANLLQEYQEDFDDNLTNKMIVDVLVRLQQGLQNYLDDPMDDYAFLESEFDDSLDVYRILGEILGKKMSYDFLSEYFDGFYLSESTVLWFTACEPDVTHLIKKESRFVRVFPDDSVILIEDVLKAVKPPLKLSPAIYDCDGEYVLPKDLDWYLESNFPEQIRAVKADELLEYVSED